MAINERTRFYLEHPNFIKEVGLRYGIPVQELDDFSQRVLMASLERPCKEIRFNRKTALLLVVEQVREYKKQLRQKDIPTAREVQDEKNLKPEEIIQKSERWLEIESTIAGNGYKITRRQKQAFLLLLSGKSKKETAEIMGISWRRVYHIIHQIRRKILKMEKKRGKSKKFS